MLLAGKKRFAIKPLNPALQMLIQIRAVHSYIQDCGSYLLMGDLYTVNPKMLELVRTPDPIRLRTEFMRILYVPIPTSVSERMHN